MLLRSAHQIPIVRNPAAKYPPLLKAFIFLFIKIKMAKFKEKPWKTMIYRWFHHISPGRSRFSEIFCVPIPTSVTTELWWWTWDAWDWNWKSLVGGWPIPLKNDGVKVSWDDDIPYGKIIHSCSKPPEKCAWNIEQTAVFALDNEDETETIAFCGLSPHDCGSVSSIPSRYVKNWGQSSLMEDRNMI